MSGETEAFARAAEDLVGTRFRLHGRSPASGLDCVGLAAAALAAIGRECAAPACYGLRNSDIAQALDFAPRAGLRETEGPVRSGDVLLVRSGPAQHHLVIAASGDRFIHAHAGLRRVGAPSAGALANVITPPGPSVQPVSSTPPTLIFTDPARGRVIGRICGSSTGP